MAESLWNALDAALKSRLSSALTGYPKLKVRTFKNALIRSPKDWDGWDLPAVVIVGEVVQREQTEFGNGVQDYGKTYPYLIIAIAEGTQESCVADAKTLEKRIEKVLRAGDILTVTGDDGESVQDWPSVGVTTVEQYRKPSSDADKWVALAAVRATYQSILNEG